MLNQRINPDAISPEQIRRNWQSVYASFVPTWEPYSKTARDFSSGSLSSTVTLFKLPPGGVVYGVKLKHTEAFSAGSYELAVGITGDLERYIGYTDVTTAPSGTRFVLASTLFDAINDDVATEITMTALSDANLNLTTSGKVSVWVYWSQIE